MIAVMVTLRTFAREGFRRTMRQGVSAVPWYATGFSPEAMGWVTVRPRAKGGLQDQVRVNSPYLRCCAIGGAPERLAI